MTGRDGCAAALSDCIAELPPRSSKNFRRLIRRTTSTCAALAFAVLPPYGTVAQRMQFVKYLCVRNLAALLYAKALRGCAIVMPSAKKIGEEIDVRLF
jgi:hypothetical protein